MDIVPTKKKKSQREGFSLVLIMIILFSFLAAYPLITRHVNNGERFAASFERWTQLQVARDSAVQICATDLRLLSPTGFNRIHQATYSYQLSSTATFTIGLSGRIDFKDYAPEMLEDDVASVTVSATAYLQKGVVYYHNVGFASPNIVASFDYTYTEFTNSASSSRLATYTTWILQ